MHQERFIKTIMYNAVLIFQVFATLLCFLAVTIVAFRKTSSYSNTILATFICSLVQNAGYIQELLASNAREGMFAIRFEYIGGAFEICLLTFFIFRYCGHEFNDKLKILLFLEGGIVLLSVWTWELTGFYYTGASFIPDSVIPHMKLSHGWLYYTNAVVTICELIACIFILIVSIIRTSRKHMINNYIILLAVVAIPFIGFVVSITGVLGPFDATPCSCAIAVALFAVSIANNHVFDVADVIGERILSDLDNAIIIINTEDGFEYANNMAYELFPKLKSYGKGEILSDHEIKEIFNNKMDEEIKIDGKYFSFNVNTVRAGRKNEVVGKTAILFDITQSKKQLVKMQELMSVADEANKSKTEFLTNISHEIRTPINTIMGMNEVLLRDYSSKDTDEYYKSINDSSTTLMNLVNDIADFSKIEGGKMTLVEDKFDFRKMLSELTDVFSFRCREKKIEFLYDIDGEIPRYLDGDVVRVKQVISNILNDSVKNTEKGTVKFKISYKHRSDFDIDLIIAIEDTGVPSEDSDRRRLLDKLSGNANGSGSGVEIAALGLNITKQLVDIMGGVINLRCDHEKGTVFSLIIPIRISKDNNDTVGMVEKKKENDKVYRTTFTAPNAKVLVVDDSLTNLIVIKELLKDTKVNLITAKSGEQCLEIMENERIDLVLLDHKMPGMDGIETFEELRKMEGQCKTVPVIMLTANATPESRSLYMSKNFTDFLTKPVSAEAIATALYKYLPETLIIEKE